MADKENPYASIYSKRRRVKEPQAFIESRSLERRVTLRILYVIGGLLVPWVMFPVMMIVKDHRPKDSKFMAAGTILGILYFIYYILFDMIIYHPNW